MGLTDLFTDRLERAVGLDRPAGAARDAVQKALRPGRVKDALHGVWLGHPLHPALAQFALGSLTSATLIDAARGAERESTRLIVAGLLSSAPTAAAGWADYADGHEEQQRVGLVHAAVNVAALTCYTAALVRRRRGRPGGRALSLAGGALGGAAAALGGHLSFRLASGANHAEDVQHVGPQDWQAVGPVAELPVGSPVQRMVGGIPAFVLRDDDRITVLSDRCPHLSAPLHDGEVHRVHGQLCVTCPWHASVFRLGDGGVVHGPATAPVPTFDTRVESGVLHARVRTLPGIEAS